MSDTPDTFEYDKKADPFPPSLSYAHCGLCNLPIIKPDEIIDQSMKRTLMSHHLLFCDGLAIIAKAIGVEVNRTQPKKNDPYYGG